MLRNQLAIGVFVSFFLFMNAHGAEHTKDTLAQVKQRVKDKKAILIDVREQGEWDRGHLAVAKLVPLSKLKAGAKPMLSKELIIYCHCRSGGRVLPAADILIKQGFDVRPLKSGYSELLKSGFQKGE